MSKEYPLFTICDMARIPPEARQRMFAELSHLIERVEIMLNATKSMVAEGLVADDPEEEILGATKWIDDDKGECRSSVLMKVEGGDPKEILSWTETIGDSA